MAMIEFKSFDLQIRGSEVAGYTVEAVGPGGERASAPFNGTAVAALSPALRAIQDGVGDRTTLEQVGTALFQALLPLDLMMVYIRVKAQIEEGEGLRLRLHLPPELGRLPWELLYYPPHYLAVDPRCPVVRFLDLPDTPRPLATRPPLRVLHLIASPEDAPKLNLEQEASLLRSALQDLAAKVEIVPGQPGTLATLREGLREGCQVLHFSGHGDFVKDKGYLFFEDDGGKSRPVNSDTLAHLLKGTNIRLAVLNACESAMAPTGDAFGSMAAALVRAGLPAVIAHQYAMPDTSAIPFAAEFYRALADGYPVDAAVGEGRKAILSELGTAWRDSIDWATPVLFMRAPDGHILSFEEKEGKAAGGGRSAAPTVHIESISDSTITFDQRMHAGPVDALPAAQARIPQPIDPLPGLLDELSQAVRDYAPKPKRDQALEKVATLRGAATQKRPNLALMEAVWKWFESELPSLSGAVLSAILGVERRLEEVGDDIVLSEFRERFDESLQ
jgi:hypothetical protein